MANPIYEQTSGNYGSAPYHESAYKAALRRLLSNIGPALSGLSAVPRGANFGDAFLAAAGASSKAVGTAQQAAQEYAMKQQQAQEDKDFREIQKAEIMARTEALKRPPKPEKPPEVQDWQRTPDEQARIIDYQSRLKKATAPAPKAGTGAGDAMPGLSDEALDAAAQRYALTGVMPSMGMGKQAAAYRAEIMNRAGKKYPAANIAANLSDYKKDSASLSNVQKIRDAAAAWEATAGRNAEVALEAMKKIPDWGIRPLNHLIRAGASALGSPGMAAFNAARKTIKDEYSRLLSSPGVAGGVISDTQRKEVEGIISGDMTKAQMVKALKILKQDSRNRRVSYDRQVQQIQGRIRGNPVGSMSTLPVPQQQGEPTEADREYLRSLGIE